MDPGPSGLSQYCWASSPSYSLGTLEVLLHSEGLQLLIQPKVLVVGSVWEFVEILRVMDIALVLICGVPPLRQKLLLLALEEVDRHHNINYNEIFIG